MHKARWFIFLISHSGLSWYPYKCSRIFSGTMQGVFIRTTQHAQGRDVLSDHGVVGEVGAAEPESGEEGTKTVIQTNASTLLSLIS